MREGGKISWSIVELSVVVFFFEGNSCSSTVLYLIVL